MCSTLAAMILVAAVNGTAATTVTLEVPGNAPVDRQAVTYKCDDRVVKAEYVNVGDNSLVVLPLDGQTVVAVTVLAASGARYAGRQYVWWTKGDHADLYDLTKGEDATPVSSCSAVR